MILGVDIGGTNTRVAAVGMDGELREVRSVPTERTIDPVSLASRVAELREGLKGRFVCAGAGVPSPLTPDRRTMRHAVSLPRFRNVPFAELLEKRLAMPVVMENDANAAAFGEYAVGAGKGSRSLVMYTLGTGVGGGVVLEGRILKGESGFAGEIGHTKVELGGLRCGCGARGCLEAYAGANYLVRACRRAGLPVAEGEDLFRLVRKGDRKALRIFRRMARALGASVASVAAALNPDAIVVGGGMSRAGPLLLRAVREEARARMFPGLFPLTRIVLAKLGSDAGLIGAALWAYQETRRR